MSTAKRLKYRIFVSHNHKDDAFGHRLVDDLRRILGEDGNVWYDSKSGRYDSNGGLRAGDNWQKVIREQLIRSNVLIVLLSKAANRSKWVRYELDIARPRCVSGNMKIISIRCDNCVVPADLNLYQIVTYLSPNDYKSALDGILKGLGLPPDFEDPDDALTQQVIRQIESAFITEDWESVIQRIISFSKRFPEMFSVSYYYMDAIAFLELGRLQYLRDIIDESFEFSIDEIAAELLNDYIQRLMQKNLWSEVLYISEYMLQKFPEKLLWVQVHDLASSHINVGKSAFVSSSVSSHGESVHYDENGNVLLDSLPVDETATNSAIDDPNTESLKIESDLLNDEEEDSISTSAGNPWRSFDTLTDLHVPPHKVSDIFATTSSKVVGIFDVIGLLVIISTTNIPNLFIWVLTGLIFLLFVLGRLLRKNATGFFLSTMLAIFWGVVGYSFGEDFNSLCHLLNLGLRSSLVTLISAILTFFCIFIGFVLHQSLFRR